MKEKELIDPVKLVGAVTNLLISGHYSGDLEVSVDVAEKIVFSIAAAITAQTHVGSSEEERISEALNLQAKAVAQVQAYRYGP